MASARSLETITAKDFRDQKDTRFRLTGDSLHEGSPISFEAELVNVTEYAENALGTFRIPFSVVFHGPAEPVLLQGTYRLEHEDLGTLEVFIVPVGPDTPGGAPEGAETTPAGMRYEAVFG
jgi:hypothetical protein